jgi:hypothetical protein
MERDGKVVSESALGSCGVEGKVVLESALGSSHSDLHTHSNSTVCTMV